MTKQTEKPQDASGRPRGRSILEPWFTALSEALSLAGGTLDGEGAMGKIKQVVRKSDEVDFTFVDGTVVRYKMFVRMDDMRGTEFWHPSFLKRPVDGTGPCVARVTRRPSGKREPEMCVWPPTTERRCQQYLDAMYRELPRIEGLEIAP